MRQSLKPAPIAVISPESSTTTPAAGAPRLGLRENWPQFILLVILNAFVGGMVGIERSVLPLLAERDFNLSSKTAILSFIVSFGIIKALSNLFAGRLGDYMGRKSVLVIGWLFGLPVPLIIMLAPSWAWIVFANVLLGINQGLCWTTTVIMKIDLVGPARRGLAMGLNEAAGYLAVSLAAIGAGYLAATYSLRPYPFVLGLIFALFGLILSFFFVRESRGHAAVEALQHYNEPGYDERLSFTEILYMTSWKNRTLFAVSQAGMINNLNDGMAWGLLPLYFAIAGLSIEKISILAAVYPAVWGLAQLCTGALSDHLGRKWMIAAGMVLQAFSIFAISLAYSFSSWVLCTILLGLGTALVYPTLLAAVSDVAHPNWRASAVGVYRLWRDGGYAVGALTAGVLADALGFRWAICMIGGLTLLSGVVVAFVMKETLIRR